MSEIPPLDRYFYFLFCLSGPEYECVQSGMGIFQNLMRMNRILSHLNLFLLHLKIILLRVSICQVCFARESGPENNILVY